MAKKRKSIATSLDEVDRTMYASFCSAANSLSQLYTQAMNHQKLSFQAGERHGLEKLYQWILRQQEAGARVTTGDILTYLQNELDHGGDEPSMSPRGPVQHHHSQTPMHITNPGFLVSGPSAQTAAAHGPRSEQYENQTKNSVFSNALSSPIRRSLQHYQLAQGGYYPSGAPPPGNSVRTTETGFPSHQNRDSNSNDSSMDMHQDSPGPESNY
uniref:Holocarboxylase synthetase n=1 Tax=Opuntia streptacantha TaxID=393608 RepID=A0A7C9CD37_OPUST